MTTAVYGGSFNPPHLGHRSVAETVLRELKPGRFLIIPDCSAPHKEMAGSSPLPSQRLELCRLAFGGLPGAEVSPMEMERGGRSYTVDTLTELRELYPEDSFILVIGSDMLLSFETCWYRFEDILGMCTLAVCSREGGDIAALEDCARHLEDEYGAEVKILLNHESLIASSTDIRREIAEGSRPAELSGEVWEYIRENRLYGYAEKH